MKSIGEALASEREKQKVSLDEISKRTNIAIKALEALEKNDFERIPRKFYLKHYIKNYLQALDSNEAEFFSANKEALDAVLPDTTEKQNTRRLPRMNYARFKNKNVFISLVLFLVVFASIFILLYFDKAPTTVEPDLKSITATVGAEESRDGLEFFLFARDMGVDYWPVEVDIEFTAQCWLRIYRGQDKAGAMEKIFKKGERFQVKGYELHFLIGSPTSVRMLVNQREVTYLKKQQNPGAAALTVTPFNLEDILRQ